MVKTKVYQNICYLRSFGVYPSKDSATRPQVQMDLKAQEVKHRANGTIMRGFDGKPLYYTNMEKYNFIHKYQDGGSIMNVIEDLNNHRVITQCSMFNRDLDIEYSEGGTRKIDFYKFNLFWIDIDNDGRNQKTISNILGKSGLKCSLWYPTFRDTPEQPRFRLGFILERIIDDPEEAHYFFEGIKKYVRDLGVVSDESCYYTHRWYFPGGPVQYTKRSLERNRISIKQIDEFIELGKTCGNEYKSSSGVEPEAKDSKSIGLKSTTKQDVINECMIVRDIFNEDNSIIISSHDELVKIVIQVLFMLYDRDSKNNQRNLAAWLKKLLRAAERDGVKFSSIPINTIFNEAIEYSKSYMPASCDTCRYKELCQGNIHQLLIGRSEHYKVNGTVGEDFNEVRPILEEVQEKAILGRDLTVVINTATGLGKTFGIEKKVRRRYLEEHGIYLVVATELNSIIQDSFKQTNLYQTSFANPIVKYISKEVTTYWTLAKYYGFTSAADYLEVTLNGGEALKKYFSRNENDDNYFGKYTDEDWEGFNPWEEYLKVVELNKLEKNPSSKIITHERLTNNYMEKLKNNYETFWKNSGCNPRYPSPDKVKYCIIFDETPVDTQYKTITLYKEKLDILNKRMVDEFDFPVTVGETKKMVITDDNYWKIKNLVLPEECMRTIDLYNVYTGEESRFGGQRTKWVKNSSGCKIVQEETKEFKETTIQGRTLIITKKWKDKTKPLKVYRETPEKELKGGGKTKPLTVPPEFVDLYKLLVRSEANIYVTLMRDEDKNLVYKFDIFYLLPKDCKTIIMSATPQVEQLKLHLHRGRKIKEYNLPKVKHFEGSSVEFYRKGIYRNSFYPSKNRKPEVAIEYMKVRINDWIEDENNLHIITYAKQDDSDKPDEYILNKLGLKGTTGHYGDSIGVNGFEGKDIILVGTPTKAPERILAIARRLGIKDTSMSYIRITEDEDNEGTFFNTFNDKRLQKMHIEMIKAEIIQAVGRGRHLTMKSRVLIFSKIIVRDI